MGKATKKPPIYLTEATREGADRCHDVAGTSARATPAEAAGGVGGGGGGDSLAVGVRVLSDGAGEGTVDGVNGGTVVGGSIGGTSACGLERRLGSNVEDTGTNVVIVGDHDGQATTNLSVGVDLSA